MCTCPWIMKCAETNSSEINAESPALVSTLNPGVPHPSGTWWRRVAPSSGQMTLCIFQLCF